MFFLKQWEAMLANGGTAQKGKSYLVGERGAEIFTPWVQTVATVTPNHAIGVHNKYSSKRRCFWIKC